jgi:uncharacterized protein YgbK (DUF1537 family)
MQLAIVADDLSGAAECAAHALMRVSRSSVVLHGQPDPADQIVTIDTDTRGRPGQEASDRLRTTAALVRSAPIVVKKVDSLLRGNLSREIASLAAELGRTPVVAVANPALARTVRGGVVHIGDTPLHATDLWRVEPAGPPLSVAHVLSPMPTVVIPQSVVAEGVGAVASALGEAARAGTVAVCDSLTEHDLSTIHSATLALGHETLLVGSGALVDVAVRALAPEPGLRGPSLGPRLASLLMLLGTRAPSAAAQLARIAEHADRVEVIAPTDLLTDPEGVAAHLASAVSAAPDARLVVVTIDPTAVVDGSTSSRLVAALADAAAPLADRFVAVFLSGGETARAVLDRLCTQTLRVVGELGTGTVVSHREGGAVVVTRPGSFGDPDSLLHVAQRLLDSSSTHGPARAPAGFTTPLGPTATATAATAQQHVTTKENP